MNIDKIEEAAAAAQIFIKRLKDLHDVGEYKDRKKHPMQRHWSLSGSKETAALRRASLDLTRALAEMRKP